MAQRTVLIIFDDPSDVMKITPSTTDDEIKEKCFRVLKYNTPRETLTAYEQTQVNWSTILDDEEDYNEFINEAYEHIKNKDYDWLEKYFI